MKVKSLDSIATKWSQRASGAGQAYKDGVSAATGWAANTAAAANNWSAGVTAAASNGSFAKGVNAAGDSAWANGSLNKGVTRYGPGVQVAQPKFSAGFGKYQQVLSNLTLPSRFPKGSPQNIDRVNAVVNALRNAKVGH
jgi:hypothetical protein